MISEDHQQESKVEESWKCPRFYTHVLEEELFYISFLLTANVLSKNKSLMNINLMNAAGSVGEIKKGDAFTAKEPTNEALLLTFTTHVEYKDTIRSSNF